MQRRELLKAFPALAAAVHSTELVAQSAEPAYKGRLRPGVVAMSFRNQLESGKMTYEDAVRYIADLGLEGMDMTGYWVPPLLDFKPGIPSQQISEMVRQTPANPTSQWLSSLRSAAYRNNVPVYSVGSPVKMAQPAPELRQKEIAFAKKWIDIADRLGAGHVRVFGGGIAKGATEEQADLIASHHDFIKTEEAAMRTHTQKMSELDEKLNALIDIVSRMQGGMESRPS